jgi:hypothetical protein
MARELDSNKEADLLITALFLTCERKGHRFVVEENCGGGKAERDGEAEALFRLSAILLILR